MLSRTAIVGAYALLAAVAGMVLLSDWQGKRQFEASERRRAAVLARPISQLKMEGLTMAQTLDALAAAGGVTIKVDPSAIAGRPPWQSQTMTLALYDLPLGRALDVVLRQISDYISLDWRWEGDEIVIATVDLSWDATKIIEIYDVRDIDISLRPHEGQATICVNTTVVTTGGGGGGGGGLFWGNHPSSTALPWRHELCDFIMQAVDPYDGWRAYGGSARDVEYHNGRLLVFAPPDIQRQVAAQLDYFRQAKDE